ncbi:MAG TPA: DUF5655 domain-containing protein [Hyphomicrobiaceae bacterium]|nr:DUF5655 domain-containing protein [Hyphomicrobiaceae bacterium]
MPRSEQEEEQEFLADLKARSGRDLAEWMAAIGAMGFTDKNQTIDWLRTQGFPFARASWLERIHSNGGRPIYAESVSRPESPPPAERPKPKPRNPEREAREAAQMDKLLAAAKGYRPLYHLLETRIRQALPAAVVTPKAAYVSIGAPREFAAVTLHATEVRLGLALGDHPFDPQLQKARMKGVGASITHMLLLTDARQVNDDLLALVRLAAERGG